MPIPGQGWLVSLGGGRRPRPLTAARTSSPSGPRRIVLDSALLGLGLAGSLALDLVGSRKTLVGAGVEAQSSTTWPTRPHSMTSSGPPTMTSTSTSTAVGDWVTTVRGWFLSKRRRSRPGRYSEVVTTMA